MSGPAVTETEKIKQKNIETYEKALQEIIALNSDIPTMVRQEKPIIPYIRERLIPEKRNGKYTIIVGGTEKELTGFNRVKTSFARRSWNAIDKVLKPLGNGKYLGLKKLEKLGELIIKIVNKAKTHKSSMMNNPKIYDKLLEVYIVNSL